MSSTAGTGTGGRSAVRATPTSAPTPPPDGVPNLEIYDVTNPNPHAETPAVFRLDSPIVMLYRDFWILLRNSWALPLVLWPLPSPGVDMTTKGLVYQVVLVAVSFFLTALVLTAFFTGVPMPALAVLSVVLWITLYNLTQPRDRVTYQTKPGDDKFEKETWLFVNGIGCSRDGLQLILDRLYDLFGRKVIGIENRTFGIWFDLLECTVQRDLLWQTTDTREGYNIITRHILDPAKQKIVLMAHSQGGIIMSSWVDQLLADFSPVQLRKVEIYTFASAANHFSIPGGVFGHVEHFVNTTDYVARIGLMAFAPGPPEGALNPVSDAIPRVNGRFAGRIFRRVGQTGHFLLTHYLKAGDSILDVPVVSASSQLSKYLLK